MPNKLHTFVILAYQESPFLEACIQSIIKQKPYSNIIIATTTPNNLIKKLANSYHINIVVGQHRSIGDDFNFALNIATTPLVTIAHQDDVYEKNYADSVIQAFHKYPQSSIIFSDYYEIRKNQKIPTNHNLRIKRLLLTPLKLFRSSKRHPIKRFPLAFGCAICCPAVTFVRKNCPQKIFSSQYKSNVDWHAWEKLSRSQTAFTYIPQKLMGHRISTDTETTKTIKAGLRTQEDYAILKLFWPAKIAKLITKLYRKSEKSNQLKTS